MCGWVEKVIPEILLFILLYLTISSTPAIYIHLINIKGQS